MKVLTKCAAVLMTAVLVLSCAALAEEGLAGMPNPWTEVDTLEELNEAADVNLQLPGVMGVTNVACRLLKTDELTIAELDFCVNGMEYCLRASGTLDEDISGVYLEDGKTAFEDRLQEGFAVVTAAPFRLARWMNISGQYVLCVNDEENVMAEDTFEAIADEMMNITMPRQPEVLAEGTYFDSFSQRACAEVTAAGDDVYAIEIHWADSAFEDNVWTMTAVMTEDGLLTYHDCECRRVITAEDGTVTELVADLIPEGYFEIAGGALYWTGAADPGCRECVFEPFAE